MEMILAKLIVILDDIPENGMKIPAGKYIQPLLFW